jgi:hypothetical protein
MTDSIGNIAVPEIVPNGVFPIIPDYSYGRSNHLLARDTTVSWFST